MRFKEIIGFSPKQLLENRHGYDDSGMSLAPGNDEGEDSWDYSAAHDRIGAGDPRRHRQHQIDVPHDVHINGRKWKTFGSHSHASNVAKKIKGATVHKSIGESATAGGTSAANVGVGAVYKNKPVKQPKNKDGTAKNAVDMNVNLLTGGSIKR
jgi:hypothetical protein